MTAMKNGVYALLAVVVGVMLVGLLPGQLSNLAESKVLMSFQGSKEAAGNATLSGTTPLRSVDSANLTVTGTITSTGQESGTKSDTNNTTTEGSGFVVTAAHYDPNADVMYYGMWGVGLIMSLGVYLIAKRMLG
jgi:hypothetical protein